MVTTKQFITQTQKLEPPCKSPLVLCEWKVEHHDKRASHREIFLGHL